MMTAQRYAELAALLGIEPDPFTDEPHPICPCGCKSRTRWNYKLGKPGFRPGHDAKLVSILLASARAYSHARLFGGSVEGLVHIHDVRQMLIHAELPKLEMKLTGLWLQVPRPKPTDEETHRD